MISTYEFQPKLLHVTLQDLLECQYHFLRVGCQLYKNSERYSCEKQPMIGGQRFSNSLEVSDWLFFT